MVTLMAVTPIDSAFLGSALGRFREGMAHLMPVMPVMPVMPLQASPCAVKPPPKVGLDYSEVRSDIERVIASVARTYTDQSCPHLHFDELQSECLAKVAKLVHLGWLERAKTRSEFFKVLTTAVKNHVRSLILRHRYTEKRTGVKPPPRRKKEDVLKGRADAHEHRKNVEVSLDDPDACLQVPDAHHTDDSAASEALEDYMRLLTPLEQLVLKQLTEPNALALMLAQIEADEENRSTRVKIKNRHLAEGIGIPLLQFDDAVMHIRDKISKHTAMNTDDLEKDARFSAAVSALAQTFNVQVPSSQHVCVSTIRRLFTIAARTEQAKVNPSVVRHLEEVGAIVPVFAGSHKSCFGWISSVEASCGQCGVREQCATKAASVGLSNITPRQKLVGQITRIPVLVPRLAASPTRKNCFRTKPEDPSSLPAPAQVPEPASKPASEQTCAPVAVSLCAPATNAVMDFIRETYAEYTETRDGVTSVYAGIQGEKASGLRRLFCIECAEPISLRFCNPKLSLRLRLHSVGNSYYLPPNTTPEEAQALINEHTTNTLKHYGKCTP